MKDLNDKVTELVIKHLSGDLSLKDTIELEELLTEPAIKRIFDQFNDPVYLAAGLKVMKQIKRRKLGLP